jgi:hypothetical protein
MSLMRFVRLGQRSSSQLALTAILGVASVACSNSADSEDVEKTDDSESDEPSDDPTGTDVPDGGGLQVMFGGEGVACGKEQCLDAQLVGYPLGAYGCCVDEDEGTCGLDMSALGAALGLRDAECEELNKPGTASDTCPASEMIQTSFPDAPAVALLGCCQTSGKCGFAADFGDVGFGCVDPAKFGQESGGDCD